MTKSTQRKIRLALAASALALVSALSVNWAPGSVNWNRATSASVNWNVVTPDSVNWNGAGSGSVNWNGPAPGSVNWN